jgi:serine/threonine-protein kinase
MTSTAAGMIQVWVDGHGRMDSFSGVPDDRGPLVPPVDPAVVFRAARLDPAAFHEVPPTLTPKHASDAVRAWKGPHPVIPNTELTLQVTFWKGRVTQAELQYPYMQAAARRTGPSSSQHVQQVVTLTVQFIGTLLLALIARKNWKQGRTDRQGALRLAGARLLAGMVVWAGLVHPVAGAEMADALEAAFSDLLGTAAFLWLVYLAVEPAIRARYPHAMVTWNRLLAGRWLDAQVWSHVLIGAALGCVIFIWFILPGAFPSNVTIGGSLGYLLGTRSWVGMTADRLANALSVGPLVFAVICGIRRLVRLDVIAALATAVIFTFALEGGVYSHSGTDLLITIGLYFSVYTVVAYVLMRLGLVATISLIFFVNSFNGLWLGADWTTWYAPTGLATITLLLGIATFAFWRSLGGRDLIGGADA